MLVGVDCLIRQLVADLLHLGLHVSWPQQQVIDAVHAALHGEEGLGLEEFLLYSYHQQLIMIKPNMKRRRANIIQE